MILTWLTQGGYLVEAGGQRLVIDPYLSEAALAKGCTRVRPPPLSAAALRPDWLLCTHDHVDHWDPLGAPELLRLHPACRLLAPRSVRPLAEAAGCDAARILPLDAGAERRCGPFRLQALPTLHSDPSAVGVLLEVDGLRCLFTADTEYATAWAKDLAARSAAFCAGAPLDLLLVCINGRLGNMAWTEALALAERLRPRCAIPNHYDLFAENLADPAPFCAACVHLGIPARTLDAGIPWSPTP